MKWRHWAILIVLVLLNYIIFSTAFTQLAQQRRPGPRPTRTPWPTYENVEPSPVAWRVLPTSTPRPTKTPLTPTSVALLQPTLGVQAPTVAPVVTSALTTTATMAVEEATPAAPTAAPTDAPPTATPEPAPAGDSVVHKIKRGETLSQIAKDYGVKLKDIMAVNDLEDPNHIVTGQELIIPSPGQVPPTAASNTTPNPTPKPKTPTPKPPTATPANTAPPAAARQQFTAQVVWDPAVAPNCSGPAISKISIVQDAGGNPVNGVRVEVNCYDNIWLSRPTGNPGEYEPGHYDFSFGQNTPQAWTCTARVFDHDGQPIESSEAVSIQFDTNDCKPHGSGHQVAILNWTKHW